MGLATDSGACRPGESGGISPCAAIGARGLAGGARPVTGPVGNARAAGQRKPADDPATGISQMNGTFRTPRPERHAGGPETGPGGLSGARPRGAGPVAFCAAILLLAATGLAAAQGTALSDRARERDANGNGVIDRSEAGGPIAANFDEMDCDRSGTLDGAEIRGFFTGRECPKAAAAPAPAPAPAAAAPPLGGRAKERDANGNGVIDRDEAGGPLAANFDEIDCNRSGTLDGAEIRGFFTGKECPKAAARAAPAAGGPAQSAGRSGAAPRSGGRPPRPVRVDEVIVESQSQTHPVLGRLVARRAGVVAALVNGGVRKMDVKVGDRVRRGDVIAVLQNPSLAAHRDRFAAALATRRSMVRTAEAELAKKKREFERIRGLRKSSSFSRARFEDLESDVRTRRAMLEERRSLEREAQADLRRIEIELAHTEIRAPYDGTVIERHAELGAYVGVGARVVTLVNDREIEVEAEVPSDRIAALKAGARMRLQLDDGTWLRGAVRAVIPNENPRTRTRPVRIVPEFADASARLAVNQSVTVMVPIGEIREVVTVHKDAIVHRGDNRAVYVARRGKAFPRQVALGDAVGNRFIVLSGLEAGDRVITYGNEALPPGAAVQIIANRLAPAETGRP